MRKIFHSYLFWLANRLLVGWDWGWHRGLVHVDWYSSHYTEEVYGRSYEIEQVDVRIGQVYLYSFKGEPVYNS